MKFMITWAMLLLSRVLASQSTYDLVISELMPDPSPQVGLPPYEWVEIRNRSSVPVQLQGFRLGDRTSVSGVFPPFILQPDSLLIICSATALPFLSVYGNAVSVSSFPSLDNESDMIVLRGADGRSIHAIEYELSWFKNALKQDGGWTLEMIDPGLPCPGAENWAASISPSGGTPGTTNSMAAPGQDNKAPKLLRAFTQDSVTIVLVFDEPLDSLSGSTVSAYQVDGGIILSSLESLPPRFTTVRMITTTPLVMGTIYQITVSGLKDCAGNMLEQNTKVKVAMPVSAKKGDLVINEVLFNPRPAGYDYVEVLNSGEKVIDMSRLFLANRNNNGDVSSIRACSATPVYIFPGDYIVFTEKPELLPLQYLVNDPGSVFRISSFPSYPDDEGNVVLLNEQGEIVDEIAYFDDWHFSLLADHEGVSLERIDPIQPGNEASNWHSAASTAGYGTPGYKNSQHRILAEADRIFIVTPEIFSPDNDGHDDKTAIQYQLADPGFVANVTIFTITGMPVRYLVRNDLLGRKGYWNWDGLGENGKKLSPGIYIVFAELFNPAGKKQLFKKSVVIAESFR